MGFNLLWRGAVVDIANEDTPGIDILTVLAHVVALLVETGLHLPQLGGFLFHFGHSPLHGFNLFLPTRHVVSIEWSLRAFKAGQRTEPSAKGR